MTTERKFLWRFPGVLLCASSESEALGVLKRVLLDDPSTVPVGGVYSLEQYLAEQHSSIEAPRALPLLSWLSAVDLEERITLDYYEMPSSVDPYLHGPKGMTLAVSAPAWRWAEYLPEGWHLALD